MNKNKTILYGLLQKSTWQAIYNKTIEPIRRVERNNISHDVWFQIEMSLPDKGHRITNDHKMRIALKECLKQNY